MTFSLSKTAYNPDTCPVRSYGAVFLSSSCTHQRVFFHSCDRNLRLFFALHRSFYRSQYVPPSCAAKNFLIAASANPVQVVRRDVEGLLPQSVSFKKLNRQKKFH